MFLKLKPEADEWAFALGRIKSNFKRDYTSPKQL